MRAGLSGYSPRCSLSCGSGMQPTSARPVGVTGSTDSENSGTDAGSGAGSGEATGGAATDDPSWGGAVDGAGVRTGHRNPERFGCGKQIASYVGLVPSEESSGDRRRLGHISKQGNSLLRFLLVEAAQVTVRTDPDWRRRFLHLAMRRERRIAKVAMARKLAVRLYWMWRKEWDYEQMRKFGSHVGEPVHRQGAS